MKKIIAIIISILVLILSAFGIYSVFFKQDKDTTLTLIEKQWIQDNKNEIIDLGIVNNVPIYNYNGIGIIFDFINELEQKTGLEFNKIPYTIGNEINGEYAFKLSSNIQENQLVLLEDNYAIMSQENLKYDNLESIIEMTLGVLESDLQVVNYYLQNNKNIKFITYKDIKTLIEAIDKDDINAIAVPKTIYLNQIIENELIINYNISEAKINLVMQLGNIDKLNTIIKKYFNKWYQESFQISYGEHLTNYYFSMKDIDDDSRVAFKSKQYKYGFIDYAPYDKTIKNELVGINNEVISNFEKISGIEVKYYEYNNLEDLISNFNSNKVDFYFDMSSIENFDMDIIDTVSIFNEQIVVLANIENKKTINSIYSLKDYNVMVLNDTDISSLMKKYEINVKEFKTLAGMLNSLDSNYLIVIDKQIYDTYKTTALKDYTDIYTTSLEAEYNYKIRDISDNKLFADYFNFYLSYIDENDYNNNVNYKMFHLNDKNKLSTGIIIISGLLIIIVASILIIKNKKVILKKSASGVSKENRIKYIDLLTSLKNRNYLNDSIEKWDECGIYPQSIIIIDLNNVAYINDNYGHAEGDNIIKEAASILFNNQIENSEIMRTNGNEFLIYLVNYDEKQVVSYIRKLTKEFKELSHGFGAAIGYSMINDGLKTIDDAINEATLDMKTNKEEVR